MGYTGDFTSKKECLKHFIYVLDSSYEPKDRPKIKITVYNYQDIVLTEKNGEKVYYCLLYFQTYDGDWSYKYMDHTVGPYPAEPINKEAKADFLSNPAYRNASFTEDFIQRIK